MDYAPPTDVQAKLVAMIGEHEVSTRPLAGGAGTVVVIKRVNQYGGSWSPGAAASFVVEPNATRERVDALWRGWWRNIASGAATHARRALRLS